MPRRTGASDTGATGTVARFGLYLEPDGTVSGLSTVARQTKSLYIYEADERQMFALLFLFYRP